MNAILLSTPRCLELLESAQALLEARANQMLTAQEWSRVRNAIAACGGCVPEEEVHDHDDE